MLPTVVRVRDFLAETHDTFTLVLDPPVSPEPPYSFSPGQFNMLYGFGLGEVPISMSGDPAETGTVVHTIRAVGSVTRGLARLRPGNAIGIRGPFGSSWPVERAQGADVVLVAGGIGLAPLRPVIYHLLRHRKDYGRLALLYGARTPSDLLFHEELQAWRSRSDFQVLITVDRADASWHGSIGLVISQFARAEFDPQCTVGMICGPEVAMRFTLAEFERYGVPPGRLYLSLERNMQCAIGFCGHCQFGPNFVCMDGPVFRHDRIKTFFDVREA
jgi:NAD(P)H-flavin reductase